MTESLTLTAEFNISKQQIYKAWLNSKSHTGFTGSPAVVNARKGGKFTAWDGYISGKNLELHPYDKIVQAWRTSDFRNEDPDSLLEISFVELKGKTRVILKHTGIPKGQGMAYRQGWLEFYFQPMKDYFSEVNR